MLRITPRFLALGCLFLGTGWAGTDNLDTYIGQEMEANRIPGLAFAVIDHDKIVAERAYGTANLETGTPLNTHGVFEIASVTKPFTATAILMLVEEGKIRLDDPIVKFIFGVIVLTNLDVASGKSHQVILAQGIVSHLRPDLPRFLP